MKTALLSTSVAVVLLAIAASYILPIGVHPDRPEPYRFAAVR